MGHFLARHWRAMRGCLGKSKQVTVENVKAHEGGVEGVKQKRRAGFQEHGVKLSVVEIHAFV